MGVLADLAQLATTFWPLLVVIPGAAFTLYAKYFDHLPWSHSVCIGLVAYSAFVLLIKMAIDNRKVVAAERNAVPIASVSLTTADERRLQAAMEEIRRLAVTVKTIHAGPHLSIEFPGCKPVSLAPPAWEVETKHALRAIVRPDIFENYESVLRSKDPENGATAFLNALAGTLSISHLI